MKVLEALKEREKERETAEMEYPACLDEYEKLVIRMNTPRVVIDNGVCPAATLVKVDSVREHGVLLEAIQVLTDLNLSIKKAYISSDGRWFMNVFHVTDHLGQKLTDDSVIAYLEQSLDTARPTLEKFGGGGAAAAAGVDGVTALELTGTDRPGLLSEIFAVLAELQCSVVEAKVWTHNGRIACIVFVRDAHSGSRISADAQRVRRIESRLCHVLKDDHDVRGATASVASMVVAHTDRRLHKMMFADRDYERTCSTTAAADDDDLSVSVQNWAERGYSIVNVQCRDRPKLLFDIVCTLTDMDYVVFHGTIYTDDFLAYQEFYIRHTDGSPISSEAERQRVILCLKAAIERRAFEGLRMEICMEDRPGILSEVTRTFRENGLLITRAEVSTKDDQASNVFYVTDAAGQTPDQDAVEAIRHRVGCNSLFVKEEQWLQRLQRKTSSGRRDRPEEVLSGVGIGFFYLGSLFRRNLYNLGLIKSCY